ncbi:MAG: hypothetical protein WBIAU2_08070 [Wolbachia endosymbiont of Drosophila biauraria]|nr:MAG: hypothetical protein WBIAU2_08070 [Wolbachia endosymbiont of Drosophila biauraria]
MLKEYPPSHISKTIVEMIDLPDIKGNSASFTLISEEKNWKGATLFISYNDKDYKPIANTNKQSTYGYVMESTDEGLIVVLRFGVLSSSYNHYLSDDVIPALDHISPGSQCLGTGIQERVLQALMLVL